LAKELQTLLDDHFLHVCFDTFYQMLPARFKPTTPADSKYVERVHLGFEYSIPALAKGGNRLIVDYPFHYADSLPRCLDLASGYTVLYVGVFCPIDVLEQREAARGDRKVGLARYQSERVHVNSEYDVEVDTDKLSPNQAAQKIISQSSSETSEHKIFVGAASLPRPRCFLPSQRGAESIRVPKAKIGGLTRSRSGVLQ
jgi:chloramphenicol 3-O phosphotransferase